MAQIKIDKRELKGPDAFVSLSDKFLSWMEVNRKIIATLALVIAVGALAYLAFGYFQDQKELAAAQAIFETSAPFKKIQDAESKAASLPGAPPVPKAAPKDTSADVQKITAEIAKYGDTKAAVVSALELAKYLVAEKRFPEALKVVESPKYNPSASDLLGGFWRMQKALVYFESGNHDKALTAYQEVVDSKDLKIFHPEAMLKLGLVHEVKGDTAKARELYEKVTREFPRTEVANTALQYLRLLELKTKQG